MECDHCGRAFKASRDLRRHQKGGQRGREKPRLPAGPVLRYVAGVKGQVTKKGKAAMKQPPVAKPTVAREALARQPVADYKIIHVHRRAICDDGKQVWLISWADTVVPDIDMNADDLVAEAMYWETKFQREFPDAIPISLMHGQ
ncbi:hypothetical protein HDE_07746 [Halotydeus destructor]|nr:hypothetical protein HDE_07746 [Halotydeus destructor]